MATATWQTANSSAPYVTLTVAQSSQNINNNTSTVSYSLVLHRPSSISSSASKDYSVTINGTRVSGTCTIGGSGNKTIKSGTMTISHNSDGTKSISFSFSLELAITWSGSSLGTATGSSSMTLTTIARASTITCSNGTLGSTHSITITRASTNFIHNLSWVCGSASGTIVYSGDTFDSSITWTPPKSLASQNSSGTSVTITFTLNTFNGSSSNFVGSKTKSVTMSMPADIKPAISEITVSDANGFLNTYGSYIKGKSRARFVITTTTSYGAAISSYKVVLSGATYTSTTNTLTSNLLTTTGTLTANITVTDKRGRTASTTRNITVIAYVQPTINSVSAIRCDAYGTENSSGEYCKLSYSLSVQALNDANTKVFQYKYKKTTETDYTTVALDNSAYDVESFVIFATDSSSSYNITILATDAFTTTQKSIKLSSTISIMNWLATGLGMAVGKIAELTNYFDIGYKTIFRDDVYMDNYSDLEKNFYFQNSASREGKTYDQDGVYPHNCKLYGASGMSPFGVGLFDNDNMIRILSYRTTDKKLITSAAGLFFNDQQTFESITLPNATYLTMQSGYVATEGYVYKWGAIVTLYIYFRNTVAIGSGNITNILLGNLALPYRPLAPCALSSGNSGPLVSGQINANGDIYLSSTTAAIAASSSASTFCLSGCYMANFTS